MSATEGVTGVDEEAGAARLVDEGGRDAGQGDERRCEDHGWRVDVRRRSRGEREKREETSPSGDTLRTPLTRIHTHTHAVTQGFHACRVTGRFPPVMADSLDDFFARKDRAKKNKGKKGAAIEDAGRTTEEATAKEKRKEKEKAAAATATPQPPVTEVGTAVSVRRLTLRCRRKASGRRWSTRRTTLVSRSSR